MGRRKGNFTGVIRSDQTKIGCTLKWVSLKWTSVRPARGSKMGRKAFLVPEHQRRDAEERRGCILGSRVKKEGNKGEITFD